MTIVYPGNHATSPSVNSPRSNATLTSAPFPTARRPKVAALAGNEAEEREWTMALPMIREVRAAGTILIGAPMYNLSVPAALKAWIDRITFPGAFTNPDSGESVLAGTRVVVVATRGGAYGPGTPREGSDFQLPYLRAYFRRHGVPDENIRCVAAELTLAGIAPHMARFRPEADRSLSAATAAVAPIEDVGRPA
jgi:FMN-dependent NADH-azoreductase